MSSHQPTLFSLGITRLVQKSAARTRWVHKCPFKGCTKAYGLKQSLESHTLFHNGETPFKCPHEGCTKSFDRPSHLKHHLALHTGNKPFACTGVGCGYRTANRGNLTRHLRTHTGEKPFACTGVGCGYRTAIRTNLTRHLRTHTAEKPFVCKWEGCGYRAAQKVNLTTHLRTHTGEKPFGCTWDGCDYRAAQMGELTIHLRTHTGEKPYNCPDNLCDDTFVTSYVAKIHWKRMHGPNAGTIHKTQERRIELALKAAGYSPCSPGDFLPPPMHYSREKRIDFTCVEAPQGAGEHSARIDFVVATRNGSVVFLEIDEHQHSLGYSNELSCDMRRIARVEESRFIDELQSGSPAVQVVWLRYNPHAYRIAGEIQKHPKTDRETWLVKYLGGLNAQKECGEARLAIRYAFYDREHPDSLRPITTTHPMFNEQFRKLSQVVGLL